MSKKANPALIGAFVVVALILAIMAVLIFGSGRFLKERHTYVAFFGGSVKGLSIGAPVVLKGVKIGTVSNILLEFRADDMDLNIPVFIEYEPERILRVDAKIDNDNEKYFDKLIKRGLRAQLQLQSMVTGQLMVSLDFYPDKPAKLLGLYKDYPEIPTIPTRAEELTNILASIPIEELINKVLSAVSAVEALVTSPELLKSMRAIPMVMQDVRKLLNNLDEQVGPLSSNLEQTTVAARKVLEQTDKTLVLVEGILAEDSPTRTELTRALEEFADAARSVRLLADFLERHPEALLRGKGGQR